MKSKFSIILYLLTFPGTFIQAQVQTQSYHAQTIGAKPEEFKEIVSRPLIVQVLEVDPGRIDYLEKRIAKAKKQALIDKYTSELERYKTFSESYNQNLKTAVEKFWKLNESVSFKTSSEVKKLVAEESTEYTILYYNEFNPMGSGLFIPRLNYTRIEYMKEGTTLLKNKSIDYSFPLPYTNHLEYQEMTLGDFALALKMIMTQIETIQSGDNNKLTIKSYLSDKAKDNCPRNSFPSLMIDKEMVGKKDSETTLDGAYKGEVKLVSSEEMLNYLSNEDEQLLGLSLPVGISKKTGTGAGVTSMKAEINFIKILVHANTGNIYASSKITNNPYYRAKELAKIVVCK